MADQKRPVLRLNGDELVPAVEDRRIEVGVYDALLPCRKYEVAYKVAVLGRVSPSLEFLLRLVKAIPGITEESAAVFFGFDLAEIAYVINEATGPGYADRREGRLWLTSAGEELFREGAGDPAIFTVEDRRRDLGFDLLAVAPQAPRHIDPVEITLPELPIEDPAATGQVRERIFERFGRFFAELAERRDREQIQQRDLYSVDRVIPKERFQVPVRIRVFSQASAPSLPEIDLSSWRPEHEISDRVPIERAAAMLVDELAVDSNQVGGHLAYRVLAELAPEFLKEFVTKVGLNVGRYWREAVGRAGEPRTDRKTIPIVGSLYTEDNTKKFLSVVEYGLRAGGTMPEWIVVMPPQIRLWGATTLQRDAMSYLRRRAAMSLAEDTVELQTVCVSRGAPELYVEKTFDKVYSAHVSPFPPALELVIIPQVAVTALVHAPIGAQSGCAVPLGWASFDQAVVHRTVLFAADRLGSLVQDRDAFGQLSDALRARQA